MQRTPRKGHEALAPPSRPAAESQALLTKIRELVLFSLPVS